MKISLVTASLNRAGVMRTALESVRRQRGAAIEYIVVDGASTDGTVELLRDFERSVAGRADFAFRWISEKDDGMYDAINKGMAMATGDVVGILNTDDFLYDDHVLEKVASAFDPDVDAVHADIRFVEDDLKTVRRYYSSNGWKPWMARWGYMPPHPSVYVRRSLIARLGDYRSERDPKTGRLLFGTAADFEWLVRCFVKGGIRTRYLPACLVGMRMGGLSTASLGAVFRQNVWNVRGLRANGIFSCLPMMLPKMFYKALGYAFKG